MNIFFDIQIAILVIITALPAVILLLNKHKKNTWENKHKKFISFLATLLLLGTLIIIYGSFIEPRLIIINQQKINLAKITEPIKIVFIADYQVGKYKQEKFVEKTVEKIIAQNPDLILFGGDMIDNEIYNEKEINFLKPLEKLTTKYPVYAIQGNHEYGIGGGKSLRDSNYRVADMSLETKNYLENIGINFLENQLTEINIKNQSFYLFGGDDFWANKLNLEPLKNREKDLATIALIHNPLAAYAVAKENVDLMLSGHTHGGQIRLPFIGPLGKVDSITPKTWYQGWNNIDEMKLFVTSGIGESGTRARLFNPPEIVILTLE